MKSELEKQFKEIAEKNGIKVEDFDSIKNELEGIGYKGQKYFKNGGIGVIEAISANSKEANALIDVSSKDKLRIALDVDTLYIIIKKERIKKNMYESYKLGKGSYFLFIGAESKTADIEKQLVSGVQGAKKLVFVMK